MVHEYIMVGITDVREVWIMQQRDILPDVQYFVSIPPLCSLGQGLPDDISPLLLCDHHAETLKVV